MTAVFPPAHLLVRWREYQTRENEMTSRQAAIHKAKDCYWLLSRRGIVSEGFSAVISNDGGGYIWQGESFDGVEWRVRLKANGALKWTMAYKEGSWR
jgi:hypothetical protein